MKTKQQASTQERNPVQKLQNTADFSGRDLYVGIDVHKQRWQVAVYHQGLVLSNISIESSSDLLVAHLRKLYPNAIFIAHIKPVLGVLHSAEIYGPLE
jgi:hypothetical protein